MDRIVKEAIDCRAVIEKVTGKDRGAVLTFAGTVRNTNLGRTVLSIDYHAYESMACKEMEKLEKEICESGQGGQRGDRAGHEGQV